MMRTKCDHLVVGKNKTQTTVWARHMKFKLYADFAYRFKSDHAVTQIAHPPNSKHTSGFIQIGYDANTCSDFSTQIIRFLSWICLWNLFFGSSISKDEVLNSRFCLSPSGSSYHIGSIATNASFIASHKRFAIFRMNQWLPFNDGL